MKLIKISRLLIFFTLLVGCVKSPLPVTSVSPKAQTPPSPSPTPEIVPTPTSKGFEIQSFCPEVSVATNGDFSELTGTMILAGDDISFYNEKFSPNNSPTSILLFWDTRSERGTIYQLPGQQFYYYLISPDRTRLAFTEGKTLSMDSEVFVLTAQGQQESSFNLPDDWTLFGWLNDEKLLSRQIRLRGENLDLVAIDPIAGKQEFLPSDFPNLYSFQVPVFWRALTIFDPSGSFVVYLERKGNEIISVLWDVQNSKEIASITGLSKWPSWATDGSRLLIVVDHEPTPNDSGHEEIFLAKPDGEVTRATFFKEHFEHNIIDLPEWSPNGRYVAFWQRTNLSASRLAVLDTETSTVDLYCNEGDPFPYRAGENNTLGYAYYQVNSAPPIWSPDSKYLLIEDYQQFRSSTFLFDLQKHSITKIADNARPVGWLK